MPNKDKAEEKTSPGEDPDEGQAVAAEGVKLEPIGPGAAATSSTSLLSSSVERQPRGISRRGGGGPRPGCSNSTAASSSPQVHRDSSGGSSTDNREMVGGCCVCSDERGWDENPLVYCDGPGCNVAVHQACYGIVSVPRGPWFCRKCETTERSVRVRCELCPSREGALKRTDNNNWAHVVCALYIPEVRFGNVSTMEPVILKLVPHERYLQVCYLCESQGRESKAATGACMQCNRQGCKQSFHVTCAQSAGLLCEEAGNYMDNVKYCGYCEYHYQRINKKVVKTIPAFKPIKISNRDSASPDTSPEKSHHGHHHHHRSGVEKFSAEASNSLGSSSSKRSKKGRSGKTSGSSSSSSSSSSGEIKLEAPKFVVESSTSSQQSFMASSKQAQKDSLDHQSWTHATVPKEEPEDISSDDKPPVVLKFSKQDNGTYYKKDVISPSSSSSPSHASSSGGLGSKRNQKDREHGGGSSSKHYHHKKDKRNREPLDATSAEKDSKVEADSSSNGNDDASTSIAPSAAAPAVASASSSEAATSSSSSALNSVSKSQKSLSRSASPSKEDSSAVDFGAKVESMEIDLSSSAATTATTAATAAAGTATSGTPSVSAQLASIKTTCTVSIDKSKVDLKHLRLSDFRDSLKTSDKTLQQQQSSGGVQLTELPKTEDSGEKKSPVDFSKAEADTSSKGVTITAAGQEGAGTSSGRVGESGDTKKSESNAAGSSDGGVTIEQVPSSHQTSQQHKEEFIISPTTGKMPRISASGKRIGRPPKKGLHVSVSAMGAAASGGNSVSGGMEGHPLRQRSPSDLSDSQAKKKRKSQNKRPINGADSASWMLGSTLNPSSAMAKEMTQALEDEIKTHSAYDQTKDKHYLGVPMPWRKRARSPSSAQSSSTNDSSSKSQQPQTLEELLERQWEQGSQFLMEQASHFDIASLLSSLHQLKEENVELEASVDNLVQRRDHLLAVRARLLALSSLSSTTGGPISSTPERQPPAQNGPRSTPQQRNSSSATVSPVSIQRASSSSSSSRSEMPRSLPPGAAPGPLPPPQQPPPSSRQQQPMHSPRDNRISPRSGSHLMENGLDYHHHQQQYHQQQMAVAAAAAAAAAAARGGGDRMLPAQLLAVASTAPSTMPARPGTTVGAAASGLPPPPPPPRQSSYPPGPPPVNMIQPQRHSGLQSSQMIRGPPPGPAPHYQNQPALPSHTSAGHQGYHIVSPPPQQQQQQQQQSHGAAVASMVTLDRSSHQHLRAPQQQHIRMEKR